MRSILDYSDYRVYLRAELEHGLRGNSAYSLRAFSKRCRMSPSYLSRILNGQRGLSAMHAGQLAQGLGLNPEERGHLLSMIASPKGTEDNSPGSKSRASKIIEMETFQAIAEWHHFAILSLTKTRQFRAEPNWIAARLGINPASVKIALERLIQLGFLRKEGVRWMATDGAHIETPPDVASAAVRENHRQHLQLAARSLDDVDVSLREFANTSISMQLRDLPAAKKRLRAFLDRFVNEFEREDGEEVMQLNLQLHPLSKVKKGRA